MAKTLFGLKMIDADERMRIDDVAAARGWRMPKRTVLTQKEIQEIFRACTRDSNATTAARDAALLAVLYGAGLRRDEASRLDVADFRHRELRVRGKGNRERLAPIGPGAARAIEAWIKARVNHGKALFLTINKAGRIGKRRLSGDAIFYAVRKLVQRASIEAASPHSLRRAFVTALLEQGADLGTASKAAGHRSISTTSLYDRRDGKRVAAVVGRLVVPFGT
jgi:site-specific recombinase XerD